MKQIFYIFLLLLVIGCSRQSSNITPKTSEADEDSIYFYWEKEPRTEKEWNEWEDSINSIASQVQELVKEGIINEQ
jgi:hypothetical protein